MDSAEEDYIADSPISDPDLVLYTDGSRRLVEGSYQTGWAVVDDTGATREQGTLDGDTSAQVAELVSLTAVLCMGAGKRVNIFTDRQFAFEVVHDYMTAWRPRGFIMAGGSQIKYENTVRDLVVAARLPLLAAIVKIKAHQQASTTEQLGNHWADQAAKAALGAPLTPRTRCACE
ncbi:hypothetical protein chiPu_0021389 [Chiloscyllium punctatum]|uniref:RNase H type-1 domain-containing protein n=1 Tax=Chiloscyllium punctatum TaxID=137246 RepID=A0A401REE9_CHIPU|nr:hypothetical protein [Chiloscyllium punctatum]